MLLSLFFFFVVVFLYKFSSIIAVIYKCYLWEDAFDVLSYRWLLLVVRFALDTMDNLINVLIWELERKQVEFILDNFL